MNCVSVTVRYRNHFKLFPIESTVFYPQGGCAVRLNHSLHQALECIFWILWFFLSCCNFFIVRGASFKQLQQVFVGRKCLLVFSSTPTWVEFDPHEGPWGGEVRRCTRPTEPTNQRREGPWTIPSLQNRVIRGEKGPGSSRTYRTDQ